MKNSIKTTVSAFLLALVFSLAGCQNGLNEDATSAKDAAAKIVVSIDSATRTLGPDVSSLTYRLVVTNNTQTIKVEEPVTGSFITKELDAGTWTVSVFAYTDTDTNLVGKATQNVILAEGETKEVSLVVQPLTNKEVAGAFSWELTLQGTDHTITLTNATLTPTSPDSAQTSPIQLRDFSQVNQNVYSGSVPLPAGQYTLDLTVTSNRQIAGNLLTAVRKEVVYIYPHLTTDASLTFTDADFDAEVYFRGTAAPIHFGSDEYKPTTVYLQLADGTERDASIASGTYEWEISALSKEISSNTNLSTVRFRYKGSKDDSNHRYSPWQTFSVSNVVGKTDIKLLDYQTPENVSASFTDGSYPLTNVVDWDPVSAPPGGHSLESYSVYRSDNESMPLVVSTISSNQNQYTDRVGFGTSYKYTVVANYGGGITSLQSAPSDFCTAPTVQDINLSNTDTTKSISSEKYQYFRVNEASNTIHTFYFTSTEVDITVQVSSVSGFPIIKKSYTPLSPAEGTNLYNDYMPIIVVVQNTDSGNGTYSFHVNN